MSNKLTKILILTSIIVGVFLVTGVIVLINQGGIKKENSTGGSEYQTIAEKTLKYLNENLLAGRATASLVETTEEYGLIKLTLKIEGNDFDPYVIDSYVTEDGKVLFPQAIILEEKTAETSPKVTEEETQKSCEELTKSDKPLLEAFVVSKCPYGLQMQRILVEIVKNIPSLAENIKVRYIGSISGDKITAMHGDTEAQENLRQICLREETDKYWDYIACHIKEGEVEGCLSEAGVDTNKLNSCMTNNSRGLKYAKEDFDLQDKYNVSGSPTLILGEEGVSEFWFGGRTAEAVKTLTCCGFEEKPNVCSQKLNESSAASGFSETYSSSGSSSSGGCPAP